MRDEGEVCELCGEDADDDTGQFIQDGKTIVAHGQCGIDAGLEFA